MYSNYILTGAPGSGKTTLINALKSLNYATVEESATDVIKQQQQDGILKPWENAAFIETVTKLQIYRRELLQKRSSENVFFDRSPVCTYALCLFLKYPAPQILLHEIKQICDLNFYAKKVFFIESLGHIQKTPVRQISEEDARRFGEIHKEAYIKFGFHLMNIEQDSVHNRIKKIDVPSLK